MKARNIVTAVLATVLFTQLAVASTNVPASPQTTAAAQQTAPVAQQPLVTAAREAGLSESYAELMQRIKTESVRELTERLDTRALVSEVVSSTVRSFMDAALVSKPTL